MAGKLVLCALRRRSISARRNYARPLAALPLPSQRSLAIDARIDQVTNLQVLVRDNNVEQALRVLKKKLQREGLFREMKARRAYEKPSEKRAREKGEAVRRARKAARKLAQREGLIAGGKR